jgi:hypothetical protein
MHDVDVGRRRRVTPRLPLAALLCAVALGIVGMHGLVSSPGTGEAVAHHAAGSSVASADATAATGGATSEDGDTQEQGAGALALCLMMLAPAMALALTWLVGARHARGWRVPALGAGLAAAVRACVPDPPPWRRLSVLRI